MYKIHVLSETGLRELQGSMIENGPVQNVSVRDVVALMMSVF